MSTPEPQIAKANAMMVAWWAETLDGLCEKEDLFLVGTSDGKACVRKESEITSKETKLVSFPKENASPGRPRRKVHIGFKLDENPAWRELEVLQGEYCDAFFVTASAARKFVYPYYEAHRLLTADQMAALKKWPFQPGVLGIGHYPPSHPVKVPGRSELEKCSYETAVVHMRNEETGVVTHLSLGSYAEFLLTQYPNSRE